MFFGPGSTFGGNRGPHLRIYYDSRTIRITSCYVDSGGNRIPIAGLSNVDQCLTSTYPIFKVAVITGGIEAALGGLLAATYGSASLVCAGAVSAAGMAIGAWGDSRCNPRLLAIEADLAGRRIIVFRTRDKREFGQVSRALLRALEEYEDR